MLIFKTQNHNYSRSVIRAITPSTNYYTGPAKIYMHQIYAEPEEFSINAY